MLVVMRFLGKNMIWTMELPSEILYNRTGKIHDLYIVQDAVPNRLLIIVD